MGLSDRKLETAIIGFSIVMIAGLGYILKAPVQSALGVQDIVYEMPRPKMSFLASLFDLGDRDVDRKYVNPFAKKKAEEKKAAETKKAQAAAVAAKLVAKQAAKKVEDAKKSKVAVTIVGADSKKGLGEDTFMGDGSTAYNNPNDLITTKAPEAPGDKDKNKNKITTEQWRALISSQPTEENLAKLVAAYHKQEIDSEGFYLIVADLFSSNRADTQALGLKAVKATYSAKSFSITSQYYEQFVPEVKEQADIYLLSYAVTGRLQFLAAVLKSSDVEAVNKAVAVVLEGYQNAKNGTTLPASDPRNTRGDIVTNSIAGYAQFIPIFQQLAESNDPTIANLASIALSQIQNAAVAAL